MRRFVVPTSSRIPDAIRRRSFSGSCRSWSRSRGARRDDRRQRGERRDRSRLRARTDLLFGEVTENFRAYGVGNTHRHLNEMRAMLADLGADADLLFTPHLLPVARGILATMTVPLAR